MYRYAKIRVADLNPHLMCVLCGGYFVDATTVIECLHSFCRTCIVRYLESSKFCPICDVQVHKTRPLLNIRSDKTLQDLVYKLVPGLLEDEMRRRREFLKEHPEVKVTHMSLEERGLAQLVTAHRLPDEDVSLILELASNGRPLEENPKRGSTKLKDPGDKRYLLCPADVSVGHLKKFIRYKFSLPARLQIDVFYTHVHEPISDDFTLLDISFVYAWKRKSPMCLYYSVYDKPRKRKRRGVTLPLKKVKDEDTASKGVSAASVSACLPKGPAETTDAKKALISQQNSKPELLPTCAHNGSVASVSACLDKLGTKNVNNHKNGPKNGKRTASPSKLDVVNSYPTETHPCHHEKTDNGNVGYNCNNRTGSPKSSTARTQSPKPSSRTQSPKPSSRTQSPKPTHRTQSPKPSSRTQSPKPSSRTQSPKASSRRSSESDSPKQALISIGIIAPPAINGKNTRTISSISCEVNKLETEGAKAKSDRLCVSENPKADHVQSCPKSSPKPTKSGSPQSVSSVSNHRTGSPKLSAGRNGKTNHAAAPSVPVVQNITVDVSVGASTSSSSEISPDVTSPGAEDRANSNVIAEIPSQLDGKSHVCNVTAFPPQPLPDIRNASTNEKHGCVKNQPNCTKDKSNCAKDKLPKAKTNQQSEHSQKNHPSSTARVGVAQSKISAQTQTKLTSLPPNHKDASKTHTKGAQTDLASQTRTAVSSKR